MVVDAWLPIGFKLPSGETTQGVTSSGVGWQIFDTAAGQTCLVVKSSLHVSWIDAHLITEGVFQEFAFGTEKFYALTCSEGQMIALVSEGRSPNSKAEALSFAIALKATREVDKESPLQDSIFVEKISRLLPTYTISPMVADDLILGYWLTGGANISVKSFRRLKQTMSWLSPSNLKDVVEKGGFEVSEVVPSTDLRPNNLSVGQTSKEDSISSGLNSEVKAKEFELPGRPNLADFFNEHVVDIVQNRARYKSLGIDFPAAVILHGPPGCGKTFAVEKLVEFLGWPSYEIDASGVASPYIHETSKKVAEIFEKAIDNAPSVLVIDEMEAFLADREMGSGHHRVEEVAEFLRRIPEAIKNDVLIVAMTNRIDMIDPAILRRGRFDHIVEVSYATDYEINALLESLLSTIPKSADVEISSLAKQLAGRPLSDVSFVVREGARLAARSQKDKIDQQSLLAALSATPARTREGGESKSIGFL